MTDTILIIKGAAHEVFAGATKDELSAKLHASLLAQCVEVPSGSVPSRYTTEDNGVTWRAPIPGPEEFYTYIDGEWVENPDRADIELERTTETLTNKGKLNKLLFKIHFDMENRMRVQEGRPSITAGQYRDALKSILGTL